MEILLVLYSVEDNSDLLSWIRSKSKQAICAPLEVGESVPIVSQKIRKMDVGWPLCRVLVT